LGARSSFRISGISREISKKTYFFSGKKHKIALLNNPAVKVNKSLRDKELKAQ